MALATKWHRRQTPAFNAIVNGVPHGPQAFNIAIRSNEGEVSKSRDLYSQLNVYLTVGEALSLRDTLNAFLGGK